MNDKSKHKAPAIRRRVTKVSDEFRRHLLEKADALRAAVRDGETDHPRVLEVAESLERLARDGD